MKYKLILFVVALSLFFNTLQASDVAVIAHSISTRSEARNVLRKLKWNEVSLKQAQGILVVCRSMLFNPLRDRYDDIGSLNKDAENQLNISGQKFHIYIYQINDDLSVTSLKHISYEAE